jgi:short-subunit dehydrogenase
MATKTILITGAGTGIGRDAAKALVAKGHKVIATTYSEAQAESLKTELGNAAEVFKLDVTDANDRAKIIQYPLDVLINNAALAEAGSLAEVDINTVRKLFEVNLFSSLELSQLAIRKMVKQGGGTIVFISSITGRIPMPFFMPYAMTKYAISAAAAGLREEMKVLDKGINVCVVEPGPYDTGFNQGMSDRRFEWMEKESLFSAQQIATMRTKSDKELKTVQSKSTASIVKKIVAAAEADKPKLRYVAPLFFAIIVRLQRIFGV